MAKSQLRFGTPSGHVIAQCHAGLAWVFVRNLYGTFVRHIVVKLHVQVRRTCGGSFVFLGSHLLLFARTTLDKVLCIHAAGSRYHCLHCEN